MGMPRLSHGGTDTTDMDGLTTLATTIMERDLLTLSPLQWLMPRLSHGIMAAMDTLGHTMVATGMERGLLTPSPLLMLRLSHGIMAAMDMGGRTTLATTITERGRLTLNQLLLPMPRQSRGGMDTTDTHGHTTVMPTMERGLLTLNQLLLLMQRLSHGIMAAMDTVGHTMVTTGVKLSTSSVTRQALSQDHA